jgi:hypothetical protein
MKLLGCLLFMECRVKKLLLIIFLSGCAVNTKTEFDLNLSGKWAWSSAEDSCSVEWHKVYVDEKQRVIIFENSKPYEQYTGERTRFYKYKIIKKLFNGYHVALESEQRKDEDGKVVTWYFLQKDDNSYIWRRSDWPQDGGTETIYRCKK